MTSVGILEFCDTPISVLVNPCFAH